MPHSAVSFTAWPSMTSLVALANPASANDELSSANAGARPALVRMQLPVPLYLWDQEFAGMIYHTVLPLVGRDHGGARLMAFDLIGLKQASPAPPHALACCRSDPNSGHVFAPIAHCVLPHRRLCPRSTSSSRA